MLYIERRVENNEEYNNIYISIVNYNLTKKSKNHYTIQSQNGIAKILYNYERRKNYEFQKNCNYHYGCFISNFK